MQFCAKMVRLTWQGLVMMGVKEPHAVRIA